MQLVFPTRYKAAVEAKFDKAVRKFDKAGKPLDFTIQPIETKADTFAIDVVDPKYAEYIKQYLADFLVDDDDMAIISEAITTNFNQLLNESRENLDKSKN